MSSALLTRSVPYWLIIFHILVSRSSCNQIFKTELFVNLKCHLIYASHTIHVQFVELHGDRAGYDDPAIVTGIGTIDGERYMFIGQQKGRNTKENIERNFGMPTPNGYVLQNFLAVLL